jgi:hypothetical protein
MQLEPKELAEIIASKGDCKIGENRNLGIQIVVVDRGFVFAGKASIEGDFCTIENAKCIRQWGTKKGLGELVNGPLPETKADESGTVLVPMKSVIAFIKCNQGW